MQRYCRLLTLSISICLLSGCGSAGLSDADAVRQIMPAESVVSSVSEGQTSESVSENASKSFSEEPVSISETLQQTDLDPSDKDDIFARFHAAQDAQSAAPENDEWLSEASFAHGGYVYHTPNDDEKTSYRNILYGLAMRKDIVVKEPDEASAGKRIDQVTADHPELFYVSGYEGVKITDTEGNTYFLIQGKYTCTPEEEADIQEKIDAAYREAVSFAADGKDILQYLNTSKMFYTNNDTMRTLTILY